MELLFIEVFLKAFILAGILALVARHEADFNYQKVAMLVAGLILGTVLIEGFLQPYLGIFVFIPSIAFFMFLIMKFCWVSLKKALLVTLIFYIVNAAMTIGFFMIVAKMYEPDSDSPQTATEQYAADLEEAAGIASEMMDYSARALEAQMADAPSPEELMEKLAAEMEQVEQQQAVEKEPVPSQIDEKLPEPAPATFSDKHMQSRKLLRIEGIMASGKDRKRAMVNGQILKTGDRISVNYEGIEYRWEAGKISQHKVNWKPVHTP